MLGYEVEGIDEHLEGAAGGELPGDGAPGGRGLPQPGGGGHHAARGAQRQREHLVGHPLLGGDRHLPHRAALRADDHRGPRRRRRRLRQRVRLCLPGRARTRRPRCATAPPTGPCCRPPAATPARSPAKSSSTSSGAAAPASSARGGAAVMIQIDTTLEPASLQADLERFWPLSGDKIRRLCETYPVEQGSPVFTVAGRYTSQGWTEWTQGFQYGSAILQFDATGDEGCLELGRRGTVAHMAAARQPRRRPRPRLQQRQHLRQPAAADAGRPPPPQRVGTGLLRAGPQGERRGAGGPLGRRPPTAPATSTRSTARTPCSATPSARCGPWPCRIGSGTGCRARTTSRSRCSTAWCSTPGPRPATTSSTARAATPTTSGAGWPTRRSSTATTAATAPRPPTRATRPSAPGPAGSAWVMLGYAEELEFLDTVARRRARPARRPGRDRSR